MTTAPTAQQTKDYLCTSPVQHMDMLQVIERGTAEMISADKSGVLLYETRSGAHMLSAVDADSARKMLRLVPSASLFTLHQDFCLEDIQQRFGLQLVMTCRQAVWPRGSPLSLPPFSYPIRGLEKRHIGRVEEMYSHAVAAGYLAARIAEGEMVGAFHGERLIGFIGLHAEGAMGMLQVDPDYRRQAVGTNLIATLSNRLLKEGKIPFSQIEIANQPSLQINQKLGFVLSSQLVYWME
jgi:Predicted acetyltransferase